MKTMSKLGLLLVAAAVLAPACAAPKKNLPAYMTASAQHPKFPKSKFLVVVGESTISNDDADARAKKRLADNISSELQAETRSFMEATTTNGRADERQRVVEDIVIKTGFSRADLISIAERERSGDVFYSVAVLDRARADQELASANRADVLSYKHYAESAITAFAAARMGEFWTAAAKAGELGPAIAASFILRRAVLGGASADEAEHRVLQDSLLKAVAVAFSKQLVIVRIDGPSDSDLMKLTNEALHKLKLRVGDQKTCAAVGAEAQMFAAELVLQPEENCSEGSLGERCEVGVQIRAASCAGGAEGRGSIPKGKGVHPSDRARARKAAWGRVLTPDLVESAVKEALKGAITTTCSNAGC